MNHITSHSVMKIHDQRSDAETVHRVLKELQLVDSPAEEAFDKITRLVTRLLQVPVALVSVVEEDRDRQFFKSQIGLAEDWARKGQTPLTHSFCQYVKAQNRPLVIECAPENPLVCDNLAIPDLGVQAYLGVPFHDPYGEPLGALAAIDTVEHSWTDVDIAVMVDLAACVTDLVELRTALRKS